MGIKEEMPLLARHEGEWEGAYTYVDAEGKVLDRHRSNLSCRFPRDRGEIAYHQTNRYRWDDGREEVHEFPATYADGRIHFDTERIRGRAWEVDDNTIVLTWTYKGQEHLHLYEMIQLSKEGNDRARTWHWFRDDRLFQRTLIDERRVAP